MVAAVLFDEFWGLPSVMRAEKIFTASSASSPEHDQHSYHVRPGEHTSRVFHAFRDNVSSGHGRLAR